MQRRSLIRSLPPLALLAGGGVLLAGCGGGGASGGDPAPAPAPTPGPPPPPQQQGKTFAYVANFESANISIYAVADTGSLDFVGTVLAGAGARAVGIHPSGRFAYAVNELENTISTYTIDAETGMLAATPAGPVAAGNGPDRIQIHPSGKFAYVPDYVNGSVLTYAINTETGALGEPASTLVGAEPEALATDASGSFLFAALADRRVVSFDIDSITGGLTLRSTVNAVSALSGMAIAPSGRVLYVAAVDEAIYTCVINAGELGAPIYAVEAPGVRSLAIDAAGRFICADRQIVSQDISCYTVEDSTTGALALRGVATLSMPGSRNTLAINPSGRSVYALVSNREGDGAGSVVAYTIDDNGDLNELMPSLPTGVDPFGMTVVRLGG